MEKREPGTELLSQGATPQVSSPLQRFTIEFGMGRSGSIALVAPGKTVGLLETLKTAQKKKKKLYIAPSQIIFLPNRTSPRSISTSWLQTLLLFHLTPSKRVFFP
jgi:hypothetical protein